MLNLNIGLRHGPIINTMELRGLDRLSIGRSPRCDVTLPAANISRRHALLFRHKGLWHLADTASRRGIRDGRRWVRHLELGPGRVAGLGPVDVWIEASTADGSGDPFTLRRLPYVDACDPEVIGGPVLSIVDGQGHRPARRFPLSGVDLVSVGRGQHCDVVLDDERVSRLHCVLYTEHRGWYIADAGSASGTRVAGLRTLRRRLADGLLAQVGDSRLWVEGNERLTPDRAAETLLAASMASAHGS